MFEYVLRVCPGKQFKRSQRRVFQSPQSRLLQKAEWHRLPELATALRNWEHGMVWSGRLVLIGNGNSPLCAYGIRLSRLDPHLSGHAAMPQPSFFLLSDKAATCMQPKSAIDCFSNSVWAQMTARKLQFAHDGRLRPSCVCCRPSPTSATQRHSAWPSQCGIGGLRTVYLQAGAFFFFLLRG